jgi:shikimate dehydrogenase
VDTLDPSAARAGAVNTLVFRSGKVEGHNTDGAGALDALSEAGVRVKGARTLLLGAGGAARAVAHALKDAGAAVTLANRSPDKAEALAKEGGFTTIPWDRIPDVLHAVDLLVNATTLGLHGEDAPADPRKLLTGAAVLDCVYLPGGTPLVRAARESGHIAVPGEAMLLHQGARAFTLWTGKPAPLGIMRAALDGGKP